jgi:hypothetical protein
MATPRVPCVMETARQARYSKDQVSGSQTPTGVPVGVVDEICMNEPGGDGATNVIGTVTINPQVTDCEVGKSILLMADFDGGATDETYTWSITAGAGSGGTSNQLQLIDANGQRTGDPVNTGDASLSAVTRANGGYRIEVNFRSAADPVTIQVSVASAAAESNDSDSSPVTADIDVAVTA